MLVLVGFSKWEPRKFDKKVTAEVAAKHNVTEKAGRYNKRLFIETPASLQAVHSAISAASETYYNETLPWSDDGCRLLPSSNYLTFCDAMRAHQAQIETAVRGFVAEYPQLIQIAKQQLNGLFKEEDYPPVSQIAERFGMATKFYPVPEGKDFRVELSKEHLASLRQQIDQDTEKAFNDAMDEAFGQLFDATAHMAEMLTAKDPKRSIKDVLVENTRATVERIKRLNLTNNPQLAEIGNRIIAQLCATDGGTLRSQDATRETVAKNAAKLTKELADILDIPMPQAEPEPVKPAKASKPAKQAKASKPTGKSVTSSAPAKPVKASKPAAAQPTVDPAAQVAAITNDLAAMMGMV